MPRARADGPPPIHELDRFAPIEVPGLWMLGWPIWAPLFLQALRTRNNESWAAAQAGVTPTRATRAAGASESFREAWSDARKAWVDLLAETFETQAREGVEKPVYQGGRRVDKGEVREFDASVQRSAMAANVDRYSKQGEPGSVHVAIYRPDRQEALKNPAVLALVCRLDGLTAGEPDLAPGVLPGDHGTQENPIDITPDQRTAQPPPGHPLEPTDGSRPSG